jgi:hypothetical protein
LTVHSVHSVGGERRRRARGFGYGGLSLSSADWSVELLDLGLSGGEVHHQNPLYLECRLAPRRCVWLNCDSGVLAGEVASS